MKIALPAGTPDMTARVENKLGTAPYLLVIDTDDMTFEAIEGPPLTAGPGSGIQAVTLALSMGAKTLLLRCPCFRLHSKEQSVSLQACFQPCLAIFSDFHIAQYLGALLVATTVAFFGKTQ